MFVPLLIPFLFLVDNLITNIHWFHGECNSTSLGDTDGKSNSLSDILLNSTNDIPPFSEWDGTSFDECDDKSLDELDVLLVSPNEIPSHS